MKKILLIILIVQLGFCKTNFDNNSDPASSSYLSKTVLHGVLLPNSRREAPPTILTNQYKTLFYVINQKFNLPSTNFISNSQISFFTVKPNLPTGMKINQNAVLTYDDDGPTTATALTKYTVSGCNSSGCANADINIQVFNTTANFVYGQSGSFINGNSNSSGINASSLSLPTDMVFDSSGGLYIVDLGNNRILYYPSGQTTATRVYGQGATGTNFASSSSNLGNITDSTFSSTDRISGIALDSLNNLYVVDAGANRVLRFPAGIVTANLVYGQSNYSNTFSNGIAISSGGLNKPISVALDSSDGLYVSDSGNNRVLYYNFGNTTPVRVYGQGGSFFTTTANKNANNLDNLNTPGGIFVSKNILYISDNGNSRILSYIGSSTTCDYKKVAFANNRFFVDQNEGIYINGNYYNSEVWIKPSEIFSTSVVSFFPYYTYIKDSKTTIISAEFLKSATHIILDSQKRIYVSDSINSRVLRFDASL